MAILKRQLQSSIFNRFTERLKINRGFRQRANFGRHSKSVKIGDVVLSNLAFSLTHNFTKSLRRVAAIDEHHKHVLVYHLVNPSREFDLEDFKTGYGKCTDKLSRQKFISKWMGYFSFESLDLRHCSYVAPSTNTMDNIDLFRSKVDQYVIHPFDDDKIFSLDEQHKLFLSHHPHSSASLPTLSKEILDMAQLEKSAVKRVKFDLEGEGESEKDISTEENEGKKENKVKTGPRRRMEKKVGTKKEEEAKEEKKEESTTLPSQPALPPKTSRSGRIIKRW